MTTNDADRRQWLRWSLGAGVLLGGVPSGWAQQALVPTGLGNGAAMPTPRQVAAGAGAALIWGERRMQGLGTHLHLRAALRAGDPGESGTRGRLGATNSINPKAEAKLTAALDAAVRAIRHVEDQFSLFDANSALSRLNRDGVLHRPHPDFVRLLRVAQRISAQSHGHFDVTVQPLWQVWRHAQTQGRLPTAQEISQAKARVGWQKVEVSANKIRFLQPGMGITLNGIAQGFAGDLAQAALQAHGVEHALLDTGEWTMRGQSADGQPWQLGLQNPRVLPFGTGPTVAAGAAGPAGVAGAIGTALLARLTTDGRAVATSSDVNLRFSATDTHHHIFNPATGYSPLGLASVTVLAGSGALADALTKVMFMGDIAYAMRSARRWGVDVLAVDKSGRWQASDGLRNMLQT